MDRTRGLGSIGRIFGVNVIIGFIATLMVCYQLLNVIRPRLSPVEAQNAHLAFSLTLVFLFSIKSRTRWLERLGDLLFLILSIAITVYIQVFFEDLLGRIGAPTTIDVCVGTLMIIVVLEATRRAFGWSIPIVAIVTLLYAYFGNYIPGFFNHAGFSYARLIGAVTTYLSGLFGSILEASTTLIAIFMIFGGFLGATGASKFFVDIAMRIGRHVRSGPALSAVVASAIFGSINGSPTANVATTGVLTIPMMKAYGFRPRFAAATEAAASTGGNFLPPIMGVAAFLMSSITGIPYPHIALHAALPALLYFIGVGFAVHLRAMKITLRPSSQHIRGRTSLAEDIITGLPFFGAFITIVMLMALKYTPGRAGLWGIFLLLIFVIIRKVIVHLNWVVRSKTNAELEVNEQDEPSFYRMMINGIIEGAEGAAKMGVVCATLGVVVKAFITTGLAGKICFQMQIISGENLWLALLLVAGVGLLFGTGVPTIGSYVIVAVLAAPILTTGGIPVIAAHFFVLFFTMISAITPPVGTAALVGAQLAGSQYWPTAWTAFRLAMPGFILPFLYVWEPSLLGYGSPFKVAMNFFSLIFGILALISFFENILLRPCILVERGILLGASVLIFVGVVLSFWFNALGLVLLAIVFWLQKASWLRKQV